ncbi:MAG TPA: SusD/RagB family nutrient-binding outer membrane lipoprotein [Chitinophagaceae bacterium]|jgi:hypothetical protein|nr:SusD/RagB family nutrient-binding outer membrane lipoprotein [Chitinophagaceae bacterium]
MKSIHSLILLLGLVLGLASCDKGFEQINTNPVLPTSLEPAYLFTNAQFSSAVGTWFYQSQIVQQINTPFTGVLEGGNHNIVYDPNTNALFNSFYTGPVKFLEDVLAKTRTDTTRSNLYNMTRIWRSYLYMVLVDTYGDVPYFSAGKAYLEGINRPAYDDQEAIYEDLLKELEDAVNKLDAARRIEKNDLFYAGSIDQWKRLGNSLLLRAGMRYTKNNPTKAQGIVQKAVDPARGGVLQSNADNAMVRFNSTNNYNSPTGNNWNGTERANYYLGKPFVDYLKTTADPRLRFIAVKYTNPSAGNLSDALPANTTPAEQEGMPYGYNEATITTAPGYPGKIGSAFRYSQINRATVGKIDAPEFFVTYAQTMLLLAEAAQRGWVTGSAQEYYEKGVRGHMDQLRQYDASAVVTPEEQTAYLAANPFMEARALELINTQYWIASFLNGSEAWANFRRSGYPQLAPNPYPGADPSVLNGFIRRLVYPVREKSVNAENVAAAIARMGPDNLATPVFWDE